jgi:hypothetical protein
MARPVKVRIRYTKDRSWLARLELAVEKDARLTSEQKGNATAAIRSLISQFMDLDSAFAPAAPVAPAAEASRREKPRRKRAESVAA